MVYIKNIKNILKKALDSNDKLVILELFKKFQNGLSPEMIDECADVARSHLGSLNASIYGDVKCFISEEKRGLSDYAACCILYAQEVFIKYQCEEEETGKPGEKYPDLFEGFIFFNKWSVFCSEYFKLKSKYISSLRRCKPVLQASTIHYMLDAIADKGYLRHISSVQHPLRIVILPYRRNGENSAYFPNENIIGVTVARKSENCDSRYIFLHEVGHALHNHIIYPKKVEENPVASFLPIYDMLFNNPLASEEDIYAFAENFADCYSLAVSVGDDELYNSNPFSTIFDAFTVQVLDFYFQELGGLNDLAEAGNVTFWHEGRKNKLIKFLCNYNPNRTKEKYVEIVYSLGYAIKRQAERNKEMSAAEMLYDCHTAIYMYHHNIERCNALPFKEAIKHFQKVF